MESLKSQLQAFYEYYCHCYVSHKFNKPLFNWIREMRMSKSRLDPSLVTFLDSLNFDWRPYSAHDQHWMCMYHELKEYKDRFGHVRVPRRRDEYDLLAVWVAVQRNTKQKLASWKIKMLDEVGFIWRVDVKGERERLWLARFGELKNFKKAHGHTRVPSTWHDKTLSKWVSRQREKEHKLPAKKKEMLDSVGFSWHADMLALDEQAWEEKYQQLKAFKEEHGHFTVPSIDPTYHSLRIWMDTQRQKEKTIPIERKKKLDAINFPWSRQIKANITRSWTRMYDELVAYYKKHGDCRVPGHSKKYPRLSSWVLKQRSEWDNLDKKKREKLKALDFDTSRDIAKEKKLQWLRMFSRLSRFKKMFGHCRVPDVYKDEPSLGKWVSTQRLNEGKLPEWKKKKLEAVGFEWSDDLKLRQEQTWYNKYDKLVEFYKRFGHSRVPEYWEEDPKLSIWVAYQRRPKKPLSGDKKRLLNDLDFIWDPKEKPRKRDKKGRYSDEIQADHEKVNDKY